MSYKLIKNTSGIYGCIGSKDILIKNNLIHFVGNINDFYKNNSDLKNQIEDVLDAKTCVVYPGFINTHHHFFQTLTRATKKAQNMKLFDWLKYHYKIWEKFDEEAIHCSSLIAMGEMMLYGVTSSSDQLYIYPKNFKTISPLEVEIEAGKLIGMRMFFTRASMTKGVSKGGLPPDELTEEDDFVLKDSERLINKYHDASRYSMCNIALSPCSPFNVSEYLFKETAALARRLGVRLHTHIAETKDEELYCLKNYALRPIDFCESLSFLGPDVWFAHGVHLTEADILKLKNTNTSISHCPQSNMRLSSGVCPVNKLKEKGVTVSLGVDGSASNDNSNIILEMRTALLLQRLMYGSNSIDAESVIDMATINGAKVFGRPEIGEIKVGNCADLAIFDLSSIEYAGVDDLLSGLVFCGPFKRAKRVYINGEITVDEGRLTKVEERLIVDEANKIIKKFN